MGFYVMPDVLEVRDWLLLYGSYERKSIPGKRELKKFWKACRKNKAYPVVVFDNNSWGAGKIFTERYKLEDARNMNPPERVEAVYVVPERHLQKFLNPQPEVLGTWGCGCPRVIKREDGSIDEVTCETCE